MMQKPVLFMVLIGCTPNGRHTEQHDVFFGIAENIKELVPAIIEFWPEAEGRMHIDAWREVTHVDGYKISVAEKQNAAQDNKDDSALQKLFFLNLGGYKQNEFEEYHYKMICVAPGKGVAVQQAKQTAFYKHTGFKGAESHIDDKYGVDVDDVYAIEDILPPGMKEKYSLLITPAGKAAEDTLNLGYFIFSKL
ncbi:MAG TPA: DUF1543 domain-containing protein [Chitinophagaceae bacterium]|nr:DUF1543 domain-containing protein [Chitinophagaceae bacterium]